MFFMCVAGRLGDLGILLFFFFYTMKQSIDYMETITVMFKIALE